MACETNNVEMQQKEFDEIMKMYKLDCSQISTEEKNWMFILYQRLVMDYLYKYKHSCEIHYKIFPEHIIWCKEINCSVKKEELK